MAPSPLAPSPVAEFIRSFLDHLRVERGVSPHTATAYRHDLQRYADFLAEQGIADPTKITGAVVTEFAVRLRTPAEGRPALADSSVARAVVAVRSLHRFGVEERITTVNPAAEVSPPTQARRLPKALTVAQVQAMLDSVDTTTPVGLRDAALLELLYGTGARISEVLGLDVDDLSRLVDGAADSTAGLRLHGKGGKERIVPLGSFARKAVQDWLVRGRPSLQEAAKAPGPALLLNTRGARLSRQSAWGVLRRTAEQAGVEAEVSPHTLRHSFATHLLDGGADVRVVQELLGHASVTTTQIYTLVTVDHLREVYLSSHPRAH